MPRAIPYVRKTTQKALTRWKTSPTKSKSEATVTPGVKAVRKATEKTRFAMLEATTVKGKTNELAKMKSPDRALTEKQKLFVKHWAAGDSIAGAAYQAGYSDNGRMAYTMAKDPAIIALYNEEKRKYEEAVGMTRQKVMDGFQEAIDMAKLMADPNAMIAGWREVGKMCGYYAPVAVKVDVNVNDNSAYGRLNRMSDAELLELAKKDRLTIEMGDAGTPLLEVEPEDG